MDPEGSVLVKGELWDAVTTGPPIAAGEGVEIVAVDGFTVQVIPESPPTK